MLFSRLLPLLAFSAGLSQAVPVISEFMADNESTLADEDGIFNDWIEISNPDERSISLLGYHLTDDVTNPTKWTFPTIILDPGATLVVFASNQNRRDPGGTLHTNFRLSAGGEYLALRGPDGVTVASEFSPGYPPQFPDESFGPGVPGSSSEIDITPNWSSPGNYYNVQINGEKSAKLAGATDNLDVNLNGSQLQYYMWFDFSSNLGSLGAETVIDSATLTWSGTVTPTIFGANGVNAELGVFPVPDANHGIDTIAATYGNEILIDYYAANTPAAAYTAVPGQTPATTWNIKSLVEDWRDNPDAAQRGQLMIINSAHPMFMDWDNSGGIPTLSAVIQTSSDPNAPAPLVYFDSPTPNAPNTGGRAAGPIFGEVTENPPQPTGGPLTVTAQISGSAGGVSTVVAFYRLAFGGESQVAMRDDGEAPDALAGDGIYSGNIPASALQAGEMTRWRFVATDSNGVQSKEPAFRNPTDSHQYFGTVQADPAIETNLNVLHWFIRNPNGANNTSGTTGAVYYHGQFYDNVHFDRHGQSTGGFVKKSYNLDFNKTQRFQWSTGAPRVADIDLLTNWADKSKVRHPLAWEIMRKSGVNAHFAFTIRVEQNGSFFSTADFVEDGDDIYLERAGLNPDGALYKVYRNRLNRDMGDTANSGVEKKNRRSENNSDLQALIDGLDLTGVALDNYIHDNIDIPKTVNLLAANSVIRNIDMHSKNWYIYRDTGKTNEWAILPWDLDLSQGRVWNRENTYFDNRVYTNGLVVTGNSIRLVSHLFNNSDTRAMIMRRIRTLADEFLQEPSTPLEERWYERRLDEKAALIDDPTMTKSDARRDFEKWGSWVQGNGSPVPYTSNNPDVESMAEALVRWKTEYLPGRRDEIYNNQTVGKGGEIPSPQTGQDLTNRQPALQFGEIEFSPATGNQDEEFVEIRNPFSFAVDVSDWQITGGIKHTFAPGTVIPNGQSLYLSPDVNTFRDRSESPGGGEGLFIQGEYKGHLSSFGETLNLHDQAGNLLTTTTFAGDPSDAQLYLVISEVMYHPDGDGLAEFIELTNISPSISLDLKGIKFVAGVEFEFTGSAVTSLAPGEKVVIVRDAAAFASVHGGDHPVAGIFANGNRLSNDGETLKLEDALNGTIHEFTYNDKSPWPEAADAGYSLILIGADLNPDPGEATNWRASTLPGGNPDASDVLAFPTDPLADPDNNGWNKMLEYALGLDLGLPNILPSVSMQDQLINGVVARAPTLTFARSLGADEVTINIEFSINLLEWRPGEDQVIQSSIAPLGDGRELVTHILSAPVTSSRQVHYRLNVVRR